MFGFSRIARHARKWRADKKRIAMENVLMDLPVELRKDIGWPTHGDRPPMTRAQWDIHTRQML